MTDIERDFAKLLRERLRVDWKSGQIWLDQQRMIMIHAEAVGQLRKELLENLGRHRARTALTRMGFASGSRDAQFARSMEEGMSDAALFAMGPKLHNLEGIVDVHPIRVEMDSNAGQCYGEFIWKGSFEAEVHRAVFGLDQEPTCWMQIGYACGYTSELFGRMVLFREVECMGKGDPHCRIIGKPVAEWPDAEADTCFFRVESVAEQMLEMQAQIENLKLSARENPAVDELIGQSASFMAACEMVDCVAASELAVLLLGETGVGKEMFARRIHARSPRAQQPFVAVNCAAIPEDLIEAELFGVERGAYTGATRSRPGRFERAHGGTLFLDEIGDLSSSAQAKLLRVLQEGEFERVGDVATRHADVRIVAATNAALPQAVAERRFRADLYYRLSPYPVTLPPLRERLADLPLLVEHFVRVYATKYSKRIAAVSDEAMRVLAAYEWPGNIRELKNIVERGVILTASGRAIEASSVSVGGLPGPGAGLERVASSNSLLDQVLHAGVPLLDLEQRVLRLAVERAKGNLSAAARLLGITRPQLAYRLSKDDKGAH